MSVQELNIEQELGNIESTWSQPGLSISQYQDTAVSQMNADDAITEDLKAGNLTLQNTSGGKCAQDNNKFKQMVKNWLAKLGTVERLQCRPEEVAGAREHFHRFDIRVQLPEASKRFDAINAYCRTWCGLLRM